MAVFLSVFMFFGVPFPVYALEQLTSSIQPGEILEETPSETVPSESEPSEAPLETPAEIVPETPVETPAVLSPETPAGKSVKLVETPVMEEKHDGLSTEIKQEEPSRNESEPLAPPAESEEPEEDVEYLVNDAVNYTKAGTLLPPILGSMAAMKGQRSMTVITPQSAAQSTPLDDPSVYLNKTAVYDEATHTVEITLEAFATGEFTTITQHIPADIVLVLDQSGSMAWDMGGNTINNSYLYDMRANLYVRDSAGNLKKVTVTRSGNSNNYTYTYSYTHTDGQTVSNTGLPGSWMFYNNTTAIRRRDVLKDALKLFVQDVYNRAVANNVDHRISMIGFASGNTDGQNYENTEILSPSTGTSPIGYTSRTNTLLKNSLLDVRNNLARLNTAIGWIEASGATRTDLGMGMAQTVIEQNPIPANTQRQRVVIMFTDGTPTTTDTFSTTVANSAIATANTMKNTLGSTVFTIGIFNGANPAGTSNENKFMNYVSSNYKNATSMDNPGAGTYTSNYYLTANNQSGLNSIFQSISSQIGGASNTSLTGASILLDLLADQFKFSSTFTAQNVDMKVYNYIGTGSDFGSPGVWSQAAPQPGGLTAVVDKPNKKLQITGFDYAANYVAYNSTTQTARGRKIVVKFRVEVNEDFIGGNQVVTNKSSSGIYAPDTSFVEAFPIPAVDIPLRYEADPVDKGIYISQSIPANELISGNGLSYKINGVSYTVDGINNAYADIEYIMYEPDGVTVLRRFTIGAGETMLSNELNLLIQSNVNGAYTFTVKVTPSLPGPVIPLTMPITAKLFIWVPTVEATDHTLWWGETTDIMDRMVHTGFTNIDPSAVSPLISVTPPAITLEPLWIAGSPVNSIPTFEPEYDTTFKVKLLIGAVDYTSYMVLDPAPSGEGHTNYHFTIFVRKGTLTIEKRLKPGSTMEENQTFLFLVIGPTGTYQVALQGEASKTIVGLKLGTYTVKELTDWSFRYEVDNITVEPSGAALPDTVADGKKVQLTVPNHDLKVIFINRKTTDKWLSGDSYAVNLQGQADYTVDRREEDGS